MNIHIILIAYALDPAPLLRSIWTSDLTLHLFLHSRREGVELACQWFADEYPNVQYYDYGVNRGLAKSWNQGLINAREEGADATIILNDDITMQKSDLYLLAEGAVEHPEAGIIVAEGFNERMNEHQILQFAIPAINPVALDTIGYFDENFTPIYYEDTDYARRAALAGVKFHNVGKTKIVHKGSATVGAVPELNAQNQATFMANQRYYCRKWGLPGAETHAVPFNDSHFNLYIAPEVRHAPYEGYNRTDIGEIVKL